MNRFRFRRGWVTIQPVIYDLFAKGYDKFLAPLEKRFLAEWRRETLSYLPSNARIIEIGAGTGANFAFYPKCKHSIACELSFEMLKIAQKKTETALLIQTDGESLPFSDRSFDAALATLVFCSISNPGKAFAELIRVLKANDRIILLEHVRPNGFLGYLFDVFSLFTVAFFDDHFNRETAKLAEASGLRIIEVKKKAFGIVNLIICEVVK